MGFVRYASNNLHERFFGGNALGGHVLFILLGMSGMFPDIMIGIRPEPTMLTVPPAIAILSALLLPFHGYDKRNEHVQAWIITFLPTISIGFIMGGAFSSQLLLMDLTLGLRDNMFKAVGLTPWPVQQELAMLTPTIILSFVAAVVVFIAYITTGHMSREMRYERFVFVDPPRNLKVLIEALGMLREHVIADKIMKAFLLLNLEGLEPLIDEAILAAMEDAPRLQAYRRVILVEIVQWGKPTYSPQSNASRIARKPRKGTSSLRH